MNGIQLLFPLALISTGVFAASPGAYMGAGGGYSNVQDSKNTIKIQNGGLGARGFLGYNFNHYVGVETNYLTMSKAKFTYHTDQNYDFGYKINALSLVAKGYLPLSNAGTFNLFGSIGAAQMHNHIETKMNYLTFLKDSEKALVPTLGVGTSYDVNQRFNTSLELSGFGQKNQEINHFGIPESTLATVNLAYKF